MPLEQQSGDGGDLILVAAVQPAQLGDLRRGDGDAVGLACVAAQIHHHPLRLAVRLGAEFTGQAQGLGVEPHRQLLFDFAHQGGLVALSRLAFATGNVVKGLAVRAGAQQLPLLEGQPGEFVDHGYIPVAN